MTPNHQNDFLYDSQYISTIIDNIPFFHDKQINAIEEIIGGWTNNNYRIDTNKGPYFMRLYSENASILGLNHLREHEIIKSASENGIAPKVYYFSNEDHVLITEFLRCQPLSPDDFGKPDTLRRVSKILRRIHALPESSTDFCPFEQALIWIRLAESRNDSLRGEYDALIDKMKVVKQAIAENHPVCLCHNDFVCSNILNCSNLMVIDWESAATGNPLFDIASIIMNGQLSINQERLFLEQYGNGESPIQENSLEPWKLVFDFLNGAFYLLNSTIMHNNKRNYQRGVLHHFTRLLHNLRKIG